MLVKITFIVHACKRVVLSRLWVTTILHLSAPSTVEYATAKHHGWFGHDQLQLIIIVMGCIC